MSKKFKELSINMMIPNMVTLIALAAGLSSIRYSIQGRWEAAVIAIMLAALFDGLDGRVARMLRGTSRFGAELDSLSDFASFGVAPAILLYLWSMDYVASNDVITGIGGVIWALSLLYCSCCGLRLARFNTMLDEEPANPLWAYYFTGIPAPGGAFLVMLPIALFIFTEQEWLKHPAVSCTFLTAVGFLMVSRLPTLSSKKMTIKASMVLPLLLGFSLLANFLISKFWGTYTFIGIAYLCSIPYTTYSFNKKSNVLNSSAGNKESKSNKVDKSEKGKK